MVVAFNPISDRDREGSGKISDSILNVRASEPSLVPYIKSVVDSDREAFLQRVDRGLTNPTFAIKILGSGEFSVLRANWVYEKLTGLSQETIQGKTIAELFSRETARVIREKFNQCIQSQSSITYEDYWQFQGKESWWQTTLIYFNDERSNSPTIVGTSINITRQKVGDREFAHMTRTEEECYGRQQEFKALVEHSPDIIVRFDRQLRHIYVNPAVKEATGMSGEAFIGKTNEELGMPPELVTEWNQYINYVFETGQDNLVEFELLTPQGEKTYQSHLVPEYARDGSVEFVIGVVRDITELKQVKEQLRSSRDFLDAVLETANEGIVVRSESDRLMIYNHQMVEITGYSKEEATNREFFTWLYPDGENRGKALAAFQTGLQGKNAHNQDWQITCKDGSKKTVLISSRVLDYDRQKWTIATFRDITERQRTQEALRHSEERYRVLVETIPYGIQEINLTGQIIFNNQACVDMFGYEPEELLQKPIWDLIDSEEEQARLRDYFAFLIVEQPEPTLYCAKNRKKDGTIFDVEVAWNYKRDRFGGLIGFVSVVTDITERKQAQEQLQASLQEKELLLKEVHHRVKNNLQVISSLFSLQSLYIQDPEILSILEESQNRIASMALIHETLYQSESLANVDFADYLQTLTRNLFDSYNISSNFVRLHLQTNNVTLNLDTAIPCGLLINELVSNSLKHAFPKREPGQDSEILGEITIVFSHLGEGKLYLQVKDNGVGLPTDVDLGQTNSLGLRLVRALTRQLRGKLNVRNQGGAIFELTFPQPKDDRRF